MDIVGITGTNGKTSCTYITRHLLLGKRGKKCGIIGTLGAFVGKQKIEYSGPQLTTPDKVQLQEIFEKFTKLKVKTVIMEVSAHGIHQNRIDGLEFRIACFTNLSRDHLDYFKTYEKYAECKVQFMLSSQVKSLVVNYDDIYGRKILAKRKDARVFRVGKTFNDSNISACVEIAREIGISERKIKKRVKSIPQIAGRFNVIQSRTGYNVVIDYAHTPDGLEKVLTSARELVSDGRLILVFGCGGDRDKEKRQVMGEIAMRLADVVVVTSDNPRSENPNEIIQQIGCSGENCYNFEDRMVATHFALRKANRGDVVVIAGKGAEQTQEINGTFVPYSDTRIVKQYLKDTKK